MKITGNIGGMILAGDNLNPQRKPCPNVTFFSATRKGGSGGEGKPVPVTGVWRSERRSDYVVYVLVFLGSIISCPLYKLTLLDQAQVSLQLRDSLSNLV
jgi:hypothetical protein